MHNAKIIRIDENIFKGRTKERKLFDRKIWLEHPEFDYNEFYEDIEFQVEDIEEKDD